MHLSLTRFTGAPRQRGGKGNHIMTAPCEESVLSRREPIGSQLKYAMTSSAVP
ncbi:hypothetical protein HMPREF1587_02077 [Bifidobacterium breve JCP7499]|nr:hypothetical protein HMPREF1587_02077 [Bifidobacterium breve JCP7499]